MNETTSDTEQPPKESSELNLYAPMKSQTSGDAQTSTDGHAALASLLVKLIGLMAIGSALYTILVNDGAVTETVVNILPGVVVGLVAALAPNIGNFAWKTKYWLVARLFVFLLAIALIIPIVIPIEVFTATSTFFACIYATVFVLEWVFRHYQAN